MSWHEAGYLHDQTLPMCGTVSIGTACLQQALGWASSGMAGAAAGLCYCQCLLQPWQTCALHLLTSLASSSLWLFGWLDGGNVHESSLVIFSAWITALFLIAFSLAVFASPACCLCVVRSARSRRPTCPLPSFSCPSASCWHTLGLATALCPCMLMTLKQVGCCTVAQHFCSALCNCGTAGVSLEFSNTLQLHATHRKLCDSAVQRFLNATSSSH